MTITRIFFIALCLAELNMLSWKEVASWQLIDRWSERFHTIGDAVQTFRVTNNQVATRMKFSCQTLDDLALGLCIKIDHDVAQKYDMKLPNFRQGIVEIYLHEASMAPQS